MEIDDECEHVLRGALSQGTGERLFGLLSQRGPVQRVDCLLDLKVRREQPSRRLAEEVAHPLIDAASHAGQGSLCAELFGGEGTFDSHPH